MRDKEYFAEWLSRTLSEREISGGEVARALGVNDSAVSRWRNGKILPSLEALMELADFLDVSPLRLAVTAGRIKEKQAGVPRLELPEDTKKRNLVRGQIMGIRGLTTEERQVLIDAYEQVVTAKA